MAGLAELPRKATKVKVSVSVDSKDVEWIDSKVDEGEFASRSHAVSKAVRRLKADYKD